MKTPRQFLLAFLLAYVGMCFAACSEDADLPMIKENIQGTWYMVNEVSFDAETTETERETFKREGELAMRFTLRSNGSCMTEEFYDGLWNPTAGTYQMTGNQLVVTYSKGSDNSVIETLTDRRLVVLTREKDGSWSRRFYTR